MISEQRILIVDSQPIVRNALKLILWNNGCKDVFEAASSEEAQVFLDTEQPSMVICEILMAPQDGLSFLRNLRASNHALANIPLVFLTSQSKAELIAEATALGADAYLLKPVTAKGLTAALLKVLKQRDSNQDGLSQPA